MLGASLEESGCGDSHGRMFWGLLEAGSSGSVASMPPPWHSLWRGTCGAVDKVAARPTRGVSRRDCWERSVFFVQSADPPVAMGGP